MQATARNYDLATLELREHYNELDESLKNDFDQLLNQIRISLLNGHDLLDKSSDWLPQLFDLRIKTLRWLAKTNQINELVSIQSGTMEYFKNISAQGELNTVIENALFAIRALRRVTGNVIQQTNINSSETKQELAAISNTNYWIFQETLCMAVPDNKMQDCFIDMADSSLEIEYAILATYLINDENLKVSDATIDDLAFLLAEAARDYTANAMKLGIVEKHVNMSWTTYAHGVDEVFKNEQQRLADSGLDDWPQDPD